MEEDTEGENIDDIIDEMDKENNCFDDEENLDYLLNLSNVNEEVITGTDNIYKTTKTNINTVIKKCNTEDEMSILDKINETVIKVNRINIHMHQFLKLYILHLYNTNAIFPKINNNFIMLIYKTVTKTKTAKGRPFSKDANKTLKKLTDFYDAHFKNVIIDEDIMDNYKLGNILRNESEIMVTCIENNIKEHFVDYVNKFVNAAHTYIIDACKNIKDLGPKNVITRYMWKMLQKVKYDLLNVQSKELTSKKIFHDWINEHKPNIIPNKPKSQFKEESVNYDVCANPLDYLRSMIYINQEINIINTTGNKKNKKIFRLFHVLPLRTSAKPKHIIIDTTSLIALAKVKGGNEYNKNIGKYEDEVWNQYFKTDIRVFRKGKKKNEQPVDVKIRGQRDNADVIITNFSLENDNFFNNEKLTKVKKRDIIVNKMKEDKSKYTFAHVISTDGVSCSILFKKTDENGIKINKYAKKKKTKVNKNIEINLKDETDNLYPYIEKVEITSEMKKKRIVVIDPNLADIISCLSRKPHTEKKSTISIKDVDINDPKQIDAKIICMLPNYRKTYINNEERIEDVEQKELMNDGRFMAVNHKTRVNDFDKFRYTQNQRRFELCSKLFAKYRADINNKPLPDGSIVAKIETTLFAHNPKTCDYDKFEQYLITKNNANRILFDHYAQKIFRKLKLKTYMNMQRSEANMINNFACKFGKPSEILLIIGDYDKVHNRKGLEPIICRKIKKIFSNHGYKVYLINEFRTSKLCHRCHGENENFLKRKSHKPKHEGKQTLVWGLVRCKNETCKLIHNRDVNACRNMLAIVESIVKGNGRPIDFCRAQKIVNPVIIV